MEGYAEDFQCLWHLEVPSQCLCLSRSLDKQAYLQGFCLIPVEAIVLPSAFLSTRSCTLFLLLSFQPCPCWQTLWMENSQKLCALWDKDPLEACFCQTRISYPHSLPVLEFFTASYGCTKDIMCSLHWTALGLVVVGWMTGTLSAQEERPSQYLGCQN